MNKTFAALAFGAAALFAAAAPAAAGGYGHAKPGVTYGSSYAPSYGYGSTVTTYQPVTTYQAVTTYKPVTTYQPVTVYKAPVYSAPVYTTPVYASPSYKPTTWVSPKRDWRGHGRHHYGFRR